MPGVQVQPEVQLQEQEPPRRPGGRVQRVRGQAGEAQQGDGGGLQQEGRGEEGQDGAGARLFFRRITSLAFPSLNLTH